MLQNKTADVRALAFTKRELSEIRHGALASCVFTNLPSKKSMAAREGQEEGVAARAADGTLVGFSLYKGVNETMYVSEFASQNSDSSVGEVLANALRENARTRGLKVILFSAASGSPAARLAQRSGFRRIASFREKKPGADDVDMNIFSLSLTGTARPGVALQ